MEDRFMRVSCRPWGGHPSPILSKFRRCRRSFVEVLSKFRRSYVEVLSKFRRGFIEVCRSLVCAEIVFDKKGYHEFTPKEQIPPVKGNTGNVWVKGLVVPLAQNSWLFDVGKAPIGQKLFYRA